MVERDPRGASLEGAPGLPRRRFLGQSLILLLMGFGRRLWAQGGVVFAPLARPVVVPLENLSTPWRGFPFVADGVMLARSTTPNRAVRINGIVVRTSAGDNSPEKFKAMCLRCPHEGCDVNFVGDPTKIPATITMEIKRTLTEPVYICPCHESTFKMEDGDRIVGPTIRGLYQFKVTAVTATGVEIGEVEEDMLVYGPEA